MSGFCAVESESGGGGDEGGDEDGCDSGGAGIA